MLFIVSLVSREKFLDKISRHILLLFSERLNSELGFMKEHFNFSNIKCSPFSSVKFRKLLLGFTLIILSEGWLTGTEVWWNSSVLYSSRSPTTRYNPQLGFYAFALNTIASAPECIEECCGTLLCHPSHRHQTLHFKSVTSHTLHWIRGRIVLRYKSWSSLPSEACPAKEEEPDIAHCYVWSIKLDIAIHISGIVLFHLDDNLFGQLY